MTIGHFLSRLCGGERVYVVTKTVPKFLSRLCGGEHLLTPYAVIAAFLSRLCGGELKQFSANLLYFQSVKER